MSKSLLLTLSLAINLALSAHLLRHARQPVSPVPHEACSPQISAREAAAGSLTLVIAGNTFRWSDLESTNYACYRDRLRAIGCPEETIRDIIEADMRATPGAQDLTNARRRYWECQPKVERLPQARFRQSERMVRGWLSALGLPPSPPVSWPDETEQPDCSFLSVAQQRRLIDIKEEFQLLTDEQDLKSAGRYTDADLDCLRQLEEARDAAIRASLTTEEWAEYQLRNSALASRLREEVIGFEPSEIEFRKIFQIEQLMEKDRAAESEPAGMEKTRITALETALGIDRAAQFLKSQAPLFQESHDFAIRSGLPPSAADVIYQARLQMEEHLESVEQQWTGAHGIEARKRIVAEAAAAIRQSLGSHYDNYVTKHSLWLSAPD